jgi:probable F420-dependent oxidoreductase
MKIWMTLPFAPLDQLSGLAAAAEAAGLDGVALGDHSCIPGSVTSRYPYADVPFNVPAAIPFPDPMVVAAWIGAATRRLRFTTSVLLLPLRNPILFAKQVATASALTGGRVELGVGVGWMREEYDAMSVPFESRGARMDEMIPLLRRLWTGQLVEHRGPQFSFPAVAVNPTPAGPVPIHVGGHSDAALRRAAALGDGWIGVDPALGELELILARLAAARSAAGTQDRPFEIRTGVKTTDGRVTPAALRSLAKLGVTSINVQPAQVVAPGTPPLGITADALAAALPGFVESVRDAV